MNIRTVSILGAGAIGGYVYHGLLPLIRSGMISFSFLCEGGRKERLDKEGLTINGNQYFPDTKTPAEAKGTDLLIVSVKYGGLRDTLPAIREAVSDSTIVLSLLNGIDSEEIISEVIRPEQVVYSLIRVSSQKNGSEISYNPASAFGIWCGSHAPYDQSRQLADLAELFEASDIPFHISEDILREQWHKYALNISANLPQAVLGVGCGAYTDSEHVRRLRDMLAEEVLAVAEAYGIHIDRVKYGNWKKDGRLSTLQDLDACRKTEIDMFLGVLMQKAGAKDIPVPCCEFTYHAVKALEEKNEGRFDY